ncbi:hypothetical protein QZH41_015461 [Actinostola sp. cb2023]|nr:hypothetical protein QZH41_015461 [Actinostola sp. cb2023]
MPKHKKNYLGRSPNVVEFERVGGGEEDVIDFLPGDLAAGQSLAAKNRGKALEDTTMRTYETRLMHLEEFASNQGDRAVLFGEGKRPFLAVTIVTFLQKKCERKGKKIGSLVCEGLSPPVVNGYNAAFRYWMNVFGHSGPYKEQIIKRDGKVVDIIPSGNPMESSGNL